MAADARVVDVRRAGGRAGPLAHDDIRTIVVLVFFSSRRRHTRYWRDWSSDVCSSDLILPLDSPVVEGMKRLNRSRHAFDDRRVQRENYRRELTRSIVFFILFQECQL